MKQESINPGEKNEQEEKCFHSIFTMFSWAIFSHNNVNSHITKSSYVTILGVWGEEKGVSVDNV